MSRKVIQVAMNGVTGRMGYRQHLVRSLLSLRDQGGVTLEDGTTLYPEPILVGRSEQRLREIAERHGRERGSPSLDEVLAAPAVSVYFDAQAPGAREASLAKAIGAGKHVYTEKPLADTAEGALRLARAARQAGVINGVVQDKLFLPGMIKLRRLVREGFFGEVLSARLEFGYWVFEGDGVPAQRPSWNYRSEDGGGIVLDMFPHWQYLLEDLLGPVTALYARHVTHVPQRWDESGRPYPVTADDAAYALLEFESGAIASVNSSWAVRVNRRELVELQVDGTSGSAVAGLRHCPVQPRACTPMPVWNPDLPDPVDYPAQWAEVPDHQVFDNGFKVQWELFLKAVAAGTPFPWDLAEGARGVQLARLALQSSAEGRRVDVPRLAGGRGGPGQPPRPDAAGRHPGSALGRGVPAAVLTQRLRGGARRRVPRRQHRLDRHARVPRIPVGSWVRGRRGDGHRAARDGAVLARSPRTDQAVRGSRGPARRSDRQRRRHRPASPRPAPAARDRPRLLRTARGGPGNRGAGRPDGQPCPRGEHPVPP